MTNKFPRNQIIQKLAAVEAIAGSLKLDLNDDLTPEDIAAGAEPLRKEQIQAELETICRMVTELALQDLRAEPEEWISACDKIQ